MKLFLGRRRKMPTRVKTTDEHGNTVFFWDRQNRIISKLLEGQIWRWELGEDFNFRCLGSETHKKKGDVKQKRSR
jgi:hypothetical protein